MNSKYVTSYFVQKYDSGIYSIVFNTSEKWMYYHRYINTMFYIGDNSEETEDHDEWQTKIQNVPDIIPKNSYMITDAQDGDQIYFYFIPFDLVFKGETILNELIEI